MRLESYEHEETDVTTRLLVEQRVEAERILSALQVALAEDGSLLTPEERAPIDRARATLERLTAGSDAGAIRQAIEALDHASKDFAGRRMDRALSTRMAGQR